MKVITIDQNSHEWLEMRKSKITGSKLGDIYAARGGKKIGFYQLIADRLALVEDGFEDARDRGHRLESEALEMAAEYTGIKLKSECGMWVSDIDDNIAISPDGCNADFTIAAEVKCLGAARHLQALIEDKIPDNSYKLQAIQYFVVCETLQTLYFVFYNPSVTAKPLHVITMHRKDFEEDITFWTEYEQNILKEVDEWVEKLAF